MNKWNCLIIDDTIDNEKKEDIIKTPDEIRVEITKWDNFQTYNFEDYDVFFINFRYYYKFDYNQTKALLTLISGEL